MVIFKKYEIPFYFKVLKFSNSEKLFFKINLNYKNLPIHSTLLFLSKSLFYLNIVIYKNKYKKYLLFNIKYVNYFNLKSLQNVIFNN